MRLIDADYFKEQIAAATLKQNIETKKGIALMELVDAQPTAYDVDKVVERLEDKALEHAINGQQFGEDGYDNHEKEERCIKQGIEESIEIVKSGGIE